MRMKIAAVVTLCLLAAASAFAQEEIEGTGTPGYVQCLCKSVRLDLFLV